MSLSFLLLLLLFLGHLIRSSRAEEKQLLAKAQLGPTASHRNRGGSGSRGRNGTSSLASSSSASSASSSSALGMKGRHSERSSFQRSASGRRTGSLYCRVGIGFHLQIHPDGKVNGSHEANMLSQVYR
ncbi:fibroblast growth factor 5 isoform X3 [Vombatus ursinus]|uniref:fibroblast growth factor 5 isoform X3 n=1 Tax=Vombatus ursinus TaxID=29139 RepID=UPI000FFD3B78|nr:fibroblast growth factor 5 isoform X3 [Vombatus ursinus]